MADRIPWDEFEIKYAKLFPSDTSNVAKPLRMALGALIIQTKQEKNWKTSYIVFASLMVCRCQDVTANVQEKII